MNRLKTFKQGDILIRENEVSRRMFVIKKGRVRVFKNTNHRDVTLAILQEGEIFGEMSFIDAEPRSASVEALSQVDAYVIESDEIAHHMESLPDWSRPIFKTVLRRLREAAARNAMLLSITEFEKKHFHKDPIAPFIYRWLYRTNKILLALYSHLSKNNPAVAADTLRLELEELVGDHSLQLQVYWNLLKDADFLAFSKDSEGEKIVLRSLSLQVWNTELKKSLDEGNPLLLSHSAYAILQRIADGCKRYVDSTQNLNETLSFSIEALEIGNMPLLHDAITELVSYALIELAENAQLKVQQPGILIKTYQNQTYLKRFEMAS